MWACGGDSAVQPHSMGGVMGRGRRDTHTHTHTGTHTHTDTHTQEHTKERARECCTYPLATYLLKSARKQREIFGSLCSAEVPKRVRSKRGRTQKHANERKRAQKGAKELKRKSATERKLTMNYSYSNGRSNNN